MHRELDEFIARAREHGLGDQEIAVRLEEAGWPREDVYVALHKGAVAPPQPLTPAVRYNQPRQPSAFSRHLARLAHLTPSAIEYRLFALLLVVSLASIVGLLDALLGSGRSWHEVALPVAVLIVCAPVVAYLFLRLQKVELVTPALHQDGVRRKAFQTVQLVAALVVLIHTVGLLYLLISGYYGSGYAYGAKPNLFIAVVRWLFTLAAAGAVFRYFWRDEHRA
ncbi:MAG TPA: hypothetical protein VLF91_06345 [Candidatus Saccharimonadales bacterium]|nr:hypothetical protein [Candidatus Saccharimonadales bacterium]